IIAVEGTGLSAFDAALAARKGLLGIMKGIDITKEFPAELEHGTRLLRDVMGNPFSPLEWNSAWQTATVTSLAQAIYNERGFDRLPILADALEDAGCDNAEMLNHCRQVGEHIRGCWVVDLILGKK